MDKALRPSVDGSNKVTTAENDGSALDWRSKISNHVAFGLLTYTGLQIFVTVAAMKSNTSSIMPYVALVVLVMAIIPGCRWFEASWNKLSDEQASDPELASAFNRDRMAIWLCAIGLPFAFAAIFKAMASPFG